MDWWRDSAALSWTHWPQTLNQQFAKEPKCILILPLNLIAETMDLLY